MDNKDFYTVRGYQIHKKNEKMLTPSMEDYMEMIYRVCRKNGYIRINVLAERLNVQAPSVSRVVEKLKARKLISYEKYGVVQLTDKGKQVGAFLLKRHKAVEAFLKFLGLQETLMDTEMIEHNISVETLKKLILFNRFIQSHPEVLTQYHEFLNKNQDRL
ncbi:MAG: metal-dependent transcriptional regulator [Caldicoprobacterales bacterium]|jgi:DtxR family Mn-dependent transcriptional regulator|nr:DtxR family transcriptional regulator [Clostridiales bacterium]